MTNPNYTHVRSIFKKTLAGQMSEEAAIDDLVRRIGRAYYAGRKGREDNETRPQKKTRLNTG
ncbi:MAG: hypothetical protein AAFQ15_05310 [Pseudomonadota bacterium]